MKYDVKPGDIVMWHSRNQRPKYGRVLIVSNFWEEIDYVLKKMYPYRETEIVEYYSRSRIKTFVVAIYHGTTDMIPYILPGTWLELGKIQVVRISERVWAPEELGISLNRFLDHPWKFGAKEELEYNITKILQNIDDVRFEIQELSEIGNTLPGGTPRGERVVKHTEDYVLNKDEARRVYQTFRKEILEYENPYMQHWIIFRRYFAEGKTIAEIGSELKRDRATVKKYISDIIEKVRLDLELQDIDADLVFWFCELLHVKGMKKRKKVS